MTPVETLTAAVALYEQRREGVTEGPYRVVEEHGRDIADEGWSYIAVAAGETHLAATAYPGGPDNDLGDVENARHFASWSPSVTDPVVQAWRALRKHPAFYVNSPYLTPVDRAVLASATAYLAGAA